MTAFIPFASTIWTLVNQAKSDSRPAFETLVGLYREPVVRYLRGRGLEVGHAEDLAQEVFLRIFQKSLLKDVAAAKGRFRSFLLGIARNVLREEAARGATEKRGGDAKILPLDESIDPAKEEKGFTRAWMIHLVRLAMKRLIDSDSDKIRKRLEVFRDQAAGKSDYAELAKKHNLTQDGVKHALYEARKDIRREVEQLVNLYAGSDEEYQEELSSFDAETVKP